MSRTIATLCIFLASMTAAHATNAEAPADPAAQEAFAVALAKAHSRTYLLAPDARPFEIQATLHSSLALRAIGEGTFEQKWVDREHWERSIHFPDYELSNVRNDSGRVWYKSSAAFTPRRIDEAIRYLFVSLPNSSSAATYLVTQTSAKSTTGSDTTCFFSDLPPRDDGFDRPFSWCFENATGLLLTEDRPLNTHVEYDGFVSFNGKQVPTRIKATVSGLPFLTVDVKYLPLENASASNIRLADGMTRAVNSEEVNPEDVTHAKAASHPIAILPASTSIENVSGKVDVHAIMGEDGRTLDVEVERTPNLAMAQAALKAMKDWTVSPTLVKGKPVVSSMYLSVFFRR